MTCKEPAVCNVCGSRHNATALLEALRDSYNDLRADQKAMVRRTLRQPWVTAIDVISD
jgi:hypothetical protein